MINLFKALLAPSSGVSSRRFITLGAFFVAVIFSALSIHFDVDNGIIYSFLGLSSSGAIATGFDKTNKNDING
ncbi:MAG: hypothetical protein HC831_21660 [Chloroflexia bacterium]|nr:hypothetical protein [Chloroflexia bacterium]